MKTRKSIFKTLFLTALILIGISFNGKAAAEPDEGMWLPIFVERLNYVDMQKMGLRLSAEEIYSINNSSIKDAIVGLSNSNKPADFFCSAEVVSEQGLLFTNHHCAFDRIQTHSSVEHDYLKDGFWAMSKEEELSNPGLTATFFVRMADITDSIVPFLSDTMSQGDRKKKIREISKDLKTAAAEDGKYHVVVKDFFEGNEFYLFVYEVHKDVRLVGAPPSAIGKFGGDTDNWMWPRHTGDFSILRVYTAPDGSPATYSEENVPMKPKHHLPISLNGVKKDDFTMIWGYPGTTKRYMTSYGIKFQLDYFNPVIIDLLGAKLEAWKEYMDADREVAIKYASKYSGLANFWKYSIGQSKGLKKLDVYSKKQNLEQQFTEWVNADPDRQERYGDVLPSFKETYESLGPAFTNFAYAIFGGAQGAEIFSFPQAFMGLYDLLAAKSDKAVIEETTNDLKEIIPGLYKNYDPRADQKVFEVSLKSYYENVPREKIPEALQSMVNDFNGDFAAMAASVYEESVFATEEKLMAFLEKPKLKTFDKDPAFVLGNSLSDNMGALMGGYRMIQGTMDENKRLFMEGLREMMPDKAFYPNANSTMRLSYGSVQDYIAADAVTYDYITHLYGAMAKEDPTNEEFIVPEKLKELFAEKDYGPYGDDKLVTCFLSTNDITGGNSGSGVINGNGELIGIAFDGNWEAMSGDIAFETAIQRTISVDIRYVLFIIDKYAGAQNLIDELTIVPKKERIKVKKQIMISVE